MKKSSILIVSVSIFALAGCQALGRTARVNPAGVSARPAAVEQPCGLTTSLAGDADFAIDLGCFKFQPKTKFSAGDSKTAYELATTGNDDTTRQARNRLEAVLINHANLICEKEKGGIYANRAFSNSVLDFLSSGFSISSTIVGGEQAKSILSGLAGLSTATRTNVDANVYQNQLVPAITKVMDAERSRLLTAISAKRGTAIKDYSADEMIMLANEYHQACSFQKGVQLLLDAAINKEGVDRILEGINLATARKNLEAAIEAQKSADPQDTQGKRVELVKALGDISLRQSANTGDSTNVVVPETDEGT